MFSDGRSHFYEGTFSSGLQREAFCFYSPVFLHAVCDAVTSAADKNTKHNSQYGRFSHFLFDPGLHFLFVLSRSCCRGSSVLLSVWAFGSKPALAPRLSKASWIWVFFAPQNGVTRGDEVRPLTPRDAYCSSVVMVTNRLKGVDIFQLYLYFFLYKQFGRWCIPTSIEKTSVALFVWLSWLVIVCFYMHIYVHPSGNRTTLQFQLQRVGCHCIKAIVFLKRTLTAIMKCCCW